MKGTKPALKADKAAITRTPKPPAWMADQARREWGRIMPLLVERKILTEADMGSVEAYCIATGQVRQMDVILAKEGAIIVTEKGARAHPAFRIQADAMNRARLLAAELGLTPVSRSRPSIRDDDDDDSLLD